MLNVEALIDCQYNPSNKTTKENEIREDIFLQRKKKGKKLKGSTHLS